MDKPKKWSKPNRGSYTKESFEAAMKAVMEQEMPIRVAARHYGIPNTTMRVAVVKKKREMTQTIPVEKKRINKN